MAACLAGKANNLKIENITFDQAGGTLSFDISWENSWNMSADYHDAVWVFAKYKASNSNQWKPIVFDDGNGNLASISGTDLEFRTKEVGFIVKSAVIMSNQNDISATTVTISGLSIEGINPSVMVFGTEMVYVPQGDYYVGDGSNSNESFSTPTDFAPVLIEQNTSEIFFRSGSSGNTIDFGTVYPNGYEDFYSMKYEITQGQMVDFFNSLNQDQQFRLTTFNFVNSFKYPLALSNTVVDRMGIAFIENNTDSTVASVFGMDLNNNGIFNEADDGATLACNFISTEYISMYLKWAGLRPMSEMEYEKACRGSEQPVRNELAIGSAFFQSLNPDMITNPGSSNEINSSGNLNLESGNSGPMRVGFSAPADASRLSSGNSFYGIANLSDNLAEYTISVESLNFNGATHGDGLFTGLVSTGWTSSIIYRGGSFKSYDGVTRTGTVSNRSNVAFGEVSAIGGRGVVSFD